MTQHAFAFVSDDSTVDANQGKCSGIVKRYNANKGFGFIKLDGPEKRDVFVHSSVCKACGYPKGLMEGQQVEVTYGPGKEPGKLQATKVEMI